MQYKYIATESNGRVIEEEVEAQNLSEVLNLLTQKGLKPVSIKPVVLHKEKNIFLKGKIDIVDQIFISKYLGLMLKLGTGLLSAINILIEDFDKPAVKSFLVEVRASVERGSPFYLVFSRHPKIFSQVYINLIKSGEVSGNLEKVFDDLTNLLTRQKDLHDQIKSALIYPIILLIGSISVFFFLITFALPKIAKVFTDSGVKIPGFSKFVFAFGLFMGQYFWYLLIFIIIAIIVFIFFYKNSLGFKKFLYDIGKSLPVIKDLIKKTNLQRFSSTLASLIKSGLPITDALDITAATVTDYELKEALARISKEGLAKGLTLGDAFKREIYFPRTLVNLIAISEKAGHIENVLDTLSDFYTKEIDATLKNLVSFLEPVLLLMIGAVIAFIALSILIPIYQLSTSFST
ncbi:MAG: type II secretion system F family protein [Minisyncoccia bacterium]